MGKQEWELEYKNAQGVPTNSRTRPSSVVIEVFEYVYKHDIDIGNDVLDLGCGNGRNALYAASLGYHVTAVDFAENGLNLFRNALKSSEYADRVELQNADLTKTWPYANDSFGLALDIVTTVSIPPKSMPFFISQLRRVVRPNGLFAAYVLSDHDGVLRENAPGERSFTVKQSGITDYYYSEDELRSLYKGWKMLKFRMTEKVDTFYGKTYDRRIWSLLLENTK